jgi:hypothetical protein
VNRALQALQQVDNLHSKGIRYLLHGPQGDVPFSPLNGSHNRPVNAGMTPKYNLGPTPGLPQIPHVLSKLQLILHLLAVWGYSGFVPTVYKQRTRGASPTGPKYTHSQHDLEKALHALRFLEAVQRRLRKPGSVEPGPLRLDMAALKAPVKMFVREHTPRAEKLWAALVPAKRGKKGKE